MASMQFFSTHSDKLAVDLASLERDGLRRAQRGAIWALASHWTVSEEPAQIVLPTGVGKTLVMTAAPFLRGARRVLVVAPSRVVREQLDSAFRSLHDLKQADALPADLPGPPVHSFAGKASNATWRDCHAADVVVSNIHNISPRYPDVVPPPPDLFDLVLVDEGHHVPADAWTLLLEAAAAPAAFVTATPFRRDRRKIPGEIAFSYPLRQAINDGVYAPISFRGVDVEIGADKDVALATAAAELMQSARHKNAGSRLLARAGRVEHAKALIKVYRDCGLKLGLVVATTSWRSLEQLFSETRTGTLDGLVCVGSLTEGFNMPELRIAAYHEPHKTLAPTLQFIGRFSRTGLDVTPELLAVREDIEGETSILYHEDSAWEELLSALVDGAIEEERAVRQFVKAGQWDSRASIEFPPLAVRPARSSRIFYVDPEAINLDIQPSFIGGAPVEWRFFSPDNDLLALVTRHLQRPRWLDSDLLDTWVFELHLVCLERTHGVLFVTSDVSRCLRELKELIGAGEAKPVDGEDLRRLAWAIAPDAWFSLGLRPTRLTGSSYEQAAGPHVENALPEERLRGRSLGHGMAGGKGRGTFGFSVKKAKLWEPEANDSLRDFRLWCEQRASDLKSAGRGTRGLPHIPSISAGERYAAFPEARVLGMVVERALIEGRVPLLIDGKRIALHEVELSVTRASDTEMELGFSRDGESLWMGAQNPAGVVTDIAGDLLAGEPRTGEVVSMGEILTEHPPIVFFADGSSIQGGRLEPPHAPHRPVPDAALRAWSWAGVDTQTEFGTAKPDHLTVHDAVVARLAPQCDFVLTDHGTGELADIIGVAGVNTDQLAVTLVHCKKAAKLKPRRRLEDIAEVLDQSARSAPRTDPAAGLWAELLRRLDSRPTYCKVLRGEESQVRGILGRLAGEPPPVLATIFAVQPGLDVSQVAGWTEGELLINLAAEWCWSFQANFQLIGSMNEEDG